MPKSKKKKKEKERLQNHLELAAGATPTPHKTPLLTKKEKKKQSKAVRSQRRNGECVFNALLAGVIGIKHKGPATHTQLLGNIKHFMGHTADLSGVTFSSPYCDRRLLCAEELEAARLVVQALHVGDGYLCAAEDPLLILAAITFRIDIEHEFLGSKLSFRVPGPVRTVFLASSRGHMAHVANVDVAVK
jgi:hypothetical protein